MQKPKIGPDVSIADFSVTPNRTRTHDGSGGEVFELSAKLPGGTILSRETYYGME
jgi:hypothetical protein